MRCHNCYLLIFIFAFHFFILNAKIIPDYKNPDLPIAFRVNDLIKRMTLEEKIGQLICPLGWEMYDKKGKDGVECSDRFGKEIDSRHTGMFWAVFRADPWTQKTLETGLNPVLAAKLANKMQRYALEKTRLGIPLFLAEECPHGHMAIGTTVFPTGIGMASTWDTSLVRKVASVVSKELRLQGVHIGYGPVIDLTRDPRWSRVEESYGEDPVLSANLVAAYEKGCGEGNLREPYGVVSTLKHFVAYGIPEGGHNGAETYVGERTLEESFLPPFKKAIEAGALSIMTSYNSIDGIPCSANKHLLTDILKKRWNFGGFSVSDLYAVDGLANDHKLVRTTKDAAIKAISAGLDVDLGANCYGKLVDAVKEGRINESVIDSSVCRVLRLKFEMGLFEHPYVNAAAARNVRSPQNIAVAREAAQECVVLLKNKDDILPLSKSLKKIALIGPNADNLYNQLGDYTAPQERKNIITVLDGLKNKLPDAEIRYVKGCSIRDTSDYEEEKALAAVKESDVTIVVVGGSSARDFKTKYLKTGAASTESKIGDIDSGEGYDRSGLDLLGNQMKLLRAVKSTGKPFIVVYIEGRPLNMNWAAENADALLLAWYPGQEGGNGIADVLFGDYNPSGRLPVSIPRSVGQLPVYYDKRYPEERNYVEESSKPLYSFGYGLSYTQFDYSDLTLSDRGPYDKEISFKLKNTGNYDGSEIVQLYVGNEYSYTVQPIEQLKHFKKVFLRKGASEVVSFELNKDDLSVVDENMQHVGSIGDFKVMIGDSSDHVKLKTEFSIK